MPYPKSPPQAEQQLRVTSNQSNAPVVAIGASAGGLEAFSDLLSHLPPDTGLSFVLIQHLDPKHQSLLPEILQQHTSMKVRAAENGLRPEPNTVYVIPPNKSMEIHQHTLQLSNRSGEIQMPIDIFFRALAADAGGAAIGVVLSGSASDGTLGLKSIKGEGGITFAQDPSSAGVDGMPRSAIAAGCVDFVLSPEEIAHELVRISTHPYVAHPETVPASPDIEKDLAEIFSILRNTATVDFSLYKHATIHRRIFRRMALHKMESVGEYVRFLREHRSEAEALFQDLLISVTAFFREPATYAGIREHVLPVLMQNRGSEHPLRIWIPGCSTGEEPYSLAITILEHMHDSGTNLPIQIFGTDLSDPALERARAGIYPESISVDVSPERLRRFFSKVNGQYQINRSVRDICVFARQNLTKDPPFSHLDLLMCRNVLIYLAPVLQKKVMKVFHYALKPTGYLVLGMSESVGGAGELFAPLDRTVKIFSRKPTAGNAGMDFDSFEDGGPKTIGAHRPPLETPLETQKRMDQMLLARYTPPAVLVNRDLHILQFRGQTSRFLEHSTGAASLNLQRMIRGGIGSEMRSLIQTLEQRRSPLESKTIAIPLDSGVEEVRISVYPTDGISGDPQYLVVFEENNNSRAREREAVDKQPRKPKTEQDKRIAQLEEELGVTRRYLQTVVEDQEAITEELKSANEEIQSSNEELQSTNEELLTAKEELQSTNEELTTVNEEMQNRNDELIRINNDLVNLLSSVNIPIVMLGNDLRIRRFTPQTERLLNLLPTDAGRPISDFKLKINVPDLEDIVHGVLDSLTPAEREVQDLDGRAYSMWIRPYRTSDNKIDGAVLALFDVTDRKQANEARYRRLFETARDGIVIVDQKTGHVLDANPYTVKLTGKGRSEMIGLPIWSLDLFSSAGIQLQMLLDMRENEVTRREVGFVRRDGEWMEAEILGNVYHEGTRDVAQFNIRDVAPRRNAAHARETGERDRDLRNLEAAGRMAASISRNFGNDLTTILILCDLLLKQNPDGSQATDVGKIRDAANRAVALDRQLLAFGHQDTGRKELVNLNDVLSDMNQMIGAVMGDRCTIETHIDPELRPVSGSPAQIERIILNLLINARNTGAATANISVETANVTIDPAFSSKHPAVQPGEYVSISVTDATNVRGSDSRAQQEGYRADPAKYSGLPAAFEAIRNVGAQVWAFSELGVGSTIRVFFPPAAHASGGAAAPAAAPANAGAILLIDPDEEVRIATARGLEATGFRVLHAESAEQARRVLENPDGNIGLVIADVDHGEANSAAAAAELAAAHNVRVAWISGEVDSLLLAQGVLNNPDLLLRKPYSTEQMASFVHQFLKDA